MNITLRALEPDDIDAIYRWENDPATWDISYAHTPFSRYQLCKYIESTLGQDIFAARQLRLVAMDGIVAVGCVDLFDYDPYHNHATVGLIVDSALRNRGYGTAIVRTLADYCRNHLGIHHLSCDIAASNVPSLQLFKHCGFQPVGHRKEYLRTPQGWADAFLLEMIL